MEKHGACWKCFRSEFGISDLFLKHLLKGGIVLLMCLLLLTQTLQWTDSAAEEWPEKYLLPFSGLVGWDVPGKALTTEACTKQRAESTWPRQEQKREGACWGSFIQCASGWVCLISRRREKKTCPVFFLYLTVLFIFCCTWPYTWGQFWGTALRWLFFSLLLFLLRIEYDAYRTDLEELNLGPRDANTLPKIEQSQQLFQVHKEKYDKMRNDVSIKLKFLEENKVSY